jgi:dCTP deaminase
MLVDHQIEEELRWGDLVITPWDPSRLQPASVDLTLDYFFRYYPTGTGTIDLKSPQSRTQLVDVSDREDQSIVIGQGQFLLASTLERLEVPANMIGRIEGKSSLARMGLFVHVTAGFIDPGFKGHITLELFNGNGNPLRLYAGMPICQVSFDYSASLSVDDGRRPNARTAYNGKYVNQQRGPKESLFWKNFSDADR